MSSVHQVQAIYFVDVHVMLANGNTQGCLELRADTLKEKEVLEQLFIEAEQDGYWNPDRIELDYRALDGYRFWSDKLGYVDSDFYAEGLHSVFWQSTFYLHEFDADTRSGDLDKTWCGCDGKGDCLICRLQRTTKIAEAKAHRAETRALENRAAFDNYLINTYLVEANEDVVGSLNHDHQDDGGDDDEVEEVEEEEEAEEEEEEEEREEDDEDEDDDYFDSNHNQSYPDPSDDDKSDHNNSGNHNTPFGRGHNGKTRPSQIEETVVETVVKPAGQKKRKREEEEAEVFVVSDEEDDAVDEEVDGTSEVDDDEDFEPAPKRQKSKPASSGRSLLPTKAKARTWAARSASVESNKTVKVAKARKTNNSMGASLDQDFAATIEALAPAPKPAATTVAKGKKGTAWTDEERQILIDLITAHRNSGEKILFDTKLFVMVSRQMEELYGIKRTPNACKNEYNRRGRLQSQVDNRKIANADRMATSIQ